MRWLIPMMIAGVLAALPSMAPAQVTQQNSGQALDANYQVGSGGYNTVNGGQGGVNSQLSSQNYITNQVTGLAGFHGPVPIEATNQLRMPVPSAAMGDFVRMSVGVPQVLANSVYSTSAYYNPSNTTFNVPGMRAGLTAPGTSAPLNQASPVAIQRLYSQVTQPYLPVLPPPQGMTPTILSPEGTAMAAPMNIVSRPGASALFGVPQYTQGTELALEVRQFLLYGGREKAPSGQEAGLNVGGQETLGGTDTRGDFTRGGRPGGVPLPNQDAYLDLLLTLQKQMQAQGLIKAPAGRPGEVQPEEPAETTPGATVGSPNFAGGKPLVERNKSGIIIHGLAGLSPDTFNLYMNRAKNLMKEGQYFDATQQYELATIVDRTNPMAALGAGISTFTGTEPFSSAVYLRRAMSLLPPLMETRLDIGSMVKMEDFEAQLKILDQRIANQTGQIDPMLLFVSAFMHQNMGQTAEARKAAKMLNESNTKEKIFHAYANFVLTGQRPTSQPATEKK